MLSIQHYQVIVVIRQNIASPDNEKKMRTY